ncbi:leukemia-associated protein 7-like [Acipenser ruthenus]|uniref:leukemia-associated protein 7-like n=1 Tax=Acipenser ruthenus TaxID=7906 RepID=UPI00145AE21E|nr:leukemia-associated protein 7-like [Acipenser ruthenus]
MQSVSSKNSSLDHQAEALRFLRKAHQTRIEFGAGHYQDEFSKDTQSPETRPVIVDNSGAGVLKANGSGWKGKHITDHRQTPVTSVRTLAQKARRSILTRLMEITSQLIAVERSIQCTPLQAQGVSIHSKDSIELRNICSRIASQAERSRPDRELKELHGCLKSITENLLSLLSTSSSDSAYRIPHTRNLRHILGAFPDI